MRQFAAVGMLLLAFLAFRHWRRGHDDYVWFAAGSGYFLLSILLPVVGKPVFALAMKLAGVLGWINTRIILTLLFTVVMTPVALVMRIAGRDALHRRWPPREATLWIPKPDPEDPRGRMERQF